MAMSLGVAASLGDTDHGLGGSEHTVGVAVLGGLRDGGPLTQTELARRIGTGRARMGIDGLCGTVRPRRTAPASTRSSR
ncbi:MAG: hypothetical protein LC792_19360 [Actinobacteria bacterium]|nr:hypothetical protein [Actinomycetota bacterium]